ncbi:TonB-dependent receptor [Mangrovimicrobium sediminis]|uniref:TonB-dependent receptor n=1 Tax=Mangrovimicrobium sediminis TaxID=2562682 RepID=A0A4Z0M030_9GAMM|nr:TonB-dependent receptor [Haliea sp. SAOS-164]TGD73023.1 TonB-dependent receptor [Haliea sp. SAOS-164]
MHPYALTIPAIHRQSPALRRLRHAVHAATLGAVALGVPGLAQAQGNPALEEVVVTAQRRAERIEDVPISLSAFDQSALNNLRIESTDQLQMGTPGIVNTSTAGDGISAIYIRGVGTGYSGPGLEGSVAVYLDDVYLQTQTSSYQATLDVAQVQVLKGPQGTLWGRNATGGAILIETRDPTLEEVEGYVKGGYGNLDWMRGEAVVNVPMGDTFALRLVGFYEERDGYVENIAVPNFEDSGVGAGETYAWRAKALWQPNEDLRLVGKLSHDRRNGNGAIHSLRYNGDGSPTGLGFYKTTQSPNREGGGGDDTESSMASLRLDWTFGDWTLTNTLAYRETRAYGCTDNDGVVDELLYFCTVSSKSPNPGGADGKEDNTLTDELRLTSNFDGPFNIVAGLFYEENEARFVGRIGGAFFGDLLPTFDNRDDLTAYSAYFDASWDITENLKLSGGLRYTYEDKDHSVVNDDDALALFGGTIPRRNNDSADFDNVSPRVVLSWSPGQTNFYASYAQGFKSGGFNSPSFTVDPVLDPEEIDAYEIGAKYRSEDGRLSLSGAAYFYDWTDMQVAFITGGGSGILQQNAAGAENYGAEFNVDWAPLDALVLRAGYAYSHARFTEFPQAAVYNLIDGALTATAEDLEDRQVPFAPDDTFTASATWFYGFGGWEGDATAAMRYSSSYDFTAGAGGELRASAQDDLTLVNLTANLRSPSGAYEFGLFVDNAGDEEYIQLVSTGNTGVYMTPAAPRTYGATVRFNF